MAFEGSALRRNSLLCGKRGAAAQRDRIGTASGRALLGAAESVAWLKIPAIGRKLVNIDVSAKIKWRRCKSVEAFDPKHSGGYNENVEYFRVPRDLAGVFLSS
jgi:hypothetical protein